MRVGCCAAAGIARAAIAAAVAASRMKKVPAGCIVASKGSKVNYSGSVLRATAARSRRPAGTNFWLRLSCKFLTQFTRSLASGRAREFRPWWFALEHADARRKEAELAVEEVVAKRAANRAKRQFLPRD